MLDIIEVARVLAEAPISADEKRAWLNLMPYMLKEDVKALVAILQGSSEEEKDLRVMYFERARNMIDQERIDEMKAELS